MAPTAARIMGVTKDIEPWWETAESPSLARRPAYSVLDINRTEAELGPMPLWKDNLADVLRRVSEGITNA